MGNTRRYLLLGILLACTVGCHKKPQKDSGTLPGTRSAEMPTERVPEEQPPTTPPLRDQGVSEEELAGQLLDIYFDFDRYNIRPEQRPRLEQNYRWLTTNKDRKVIIEGHCDERGTEEYNLALGDRRANATREYLQSRGIPPNQMSTISYGKAYPVDPGHNEVAWAKNRRAHFTLVPARTGESGSGRF